MNKSCSESIKSWGLVIIWGVRLQKDSKSFLKKGKNTSLTCLPCKALQSFCMDRNTLAIRQFCVKIRVKMSFLISFIVPLVIYHIQNVKFLMYLLAQNQTMFIYLFVLYRHVWIWLNPCRSLWIMHVKSKKSLYWVSTHTHTHKKKKPKNPTHQAYHFSTICCGIKR